MRPMLLTTALTLFVAGAALAADPIPPRAPDKPIPAAEDQAVETAKFGAQSAAQAISPENLPVDADKSAATALRPAMLEELRIVREEEVRRVAELTTSLASASSSDRRTRAATADQRRQECLPADHDHPARIRAPRRPAGTRQRLEADIEQFETLRNAPRAPISTETSATARPAEVRRDDESPP